MRHGVFMLALAWTLWIESFGLGSGLITETERPVRAVSTLGECEALRGQQVVATYRQLLSVASREQREVSLTPDGVTVSRVQYALDAPAEHELLAHRYECREGVSTASR